MELSRPRSALEQQLFRARSVLVTSSPINTRKSEQEIVAPGTPLGAGLTKVRGARFRPARRHAGRRVADRRARRRRRHDRRTREGRVRRSMCAVVLPTSWGPRPASWRRRRSLASSRASGVPIIREWFPGSGSTKADSPQPVRPSITSSDPIPRYNEAVAAAQVRGIEVLEFLERRIVSRATDLGEAALLARDIHVLPEFLGNRSPFADPDSARDRRRDGSRRRHRFDGAAVRGRAVRPGLRPCRCRRCVPDRMASTATMMVISGGAGRSRAGSPDHGGYDRPDRCGPRNAGARPARRGHAGRGRRRSCCGSIGEAMASMSAIGRLSEPTRAGNGRLPPDKATSPWTDAKARARQPQCDAGGSH